MEPVRLDQPVGPSHTTAPRDVKSVKRALSALEFLKPSSSSTTGILNRELFDGVRRFQRDNGLRADAVLEPNGPTARLMIAALMERTSGAAGGAGRRSESRKSRPAAGLQPQAGRPD